VSVVPSSVAAVFAAAAGLSVEGVMRWGERVAPTESGVYAVALSDAPESPAGTLPAAPLSRAAIEEAPRGSARADAGRPAADELAARIAAFWLPDEPIVYIGLATSLRSSSVLSTTGTASGLPCHLVGADPPRMFARDAIEEELNARGITTRDADGNPCASFEG
jgi:hypothetical protein